MIKQLNHNNAFTLTELLIGIMIILPLCAVTMKLFVDCTQVNNMSRNQTLALSSLVTRLSAVEKTSFSQIFTTYNNQTFTLPGLNGKGITYVNNTNPNYITVTLSFSWKESNNRIIGEDLDLDGLIDSGEDTNNNGQLNSPVQLTSIIYEP